MKGKRYRSKWALWRSRNRLDGEVQPPKMELCDLGSNEILESKKTDVVERVTAITGLDYPRFLRSVMLAQGDFAAFLRAKESDKGELLEKITGTDLYTKLSQQAFQRKKKEEERLRELERKLTRHNCSPANSKPKSRRISGHAKPKKIVSPPASKPSKPGTSGCCASANWKPRRSNWRGNWPRCNRKRTPTPTTSAATTCT